MKLTYNAIKAGAVGVDMGRNIWQSENPVPMIRAIRTIVHGNASVDQAFEFYTQLCGPNQNKPKKSDQTKPEKPKESKPTKSNQTEEPEKTQETEK